MAKKIQLQTNGKEWQVVDGEQVLVDVEKQDIDPMTDSSCVRIEGFRTLEEAVSDNKMLSQNLTYTKVMDKVGGDYHQNVLDGQYSKAILYGNTQVNLCEEDSSVALQIPTTFTSFNNGELQIKNKESQVVAPLIKGVTMVNLAQINSSSVASGKGVPIQNVKGNTVYTLSFTFSTKNTNSGVVIECYDVNGEYLGNVMHKTGLGDVVKFTFTTHANATKVHICNNPTYGGETIQLDEIMLIEGDQTALDIPFFKGMKSVELVRPLTNLFTDDITTYEAGATATNNSGDVVVTSKSSASWSAISFKMNMLKNNTKYLVMWDNLTATQTSVSNNGHLIGVYYVDTSSQTIGTINNNTLCPTKKGLIFDTKDFDVAKIWLKIHATLDNTETATTTVTGLRIFEYDDYLRSVDLQSIGYFSGTKNVAVEPIKTCSKNLYPYEEISYTSHLTNVDIWFDSIGTSHIHGDVAQKSKARFLLKKGTYTITTGVWVNVAACQIVDDKEQIIVKLDSGQRNHTFTLLQDTYCTLRFKVIELEVWANIKNIQIERGETATDYVAHDSRYYEPDGQNAIVLRSLPNGVCDTFNLQTGEYVQRINEVVFDGSSDESWVKNTSLSDDNYTILHNVGYTEMKVETDTLVGNMNCDKFKNEWYAIDGGEGIARYANGKEIVLKISTSKLTTQDSVGLREYLASNPITVQYELATPITTIIPRTIKRNNNGTISTINFGTYTNKESLVVPSNPSYLTINSMTSIKPVVEPITYLDFKTRLKANTDYSVIMDKDSANKTINLGGTSKTYSDKMLVRTPSVDLEQNLRISGSGSIQNIMVIEGDVLDKELPYFNGMCNVKMPIVRNSGKNLVDFDRDKTNWWVNNEGLSKGDDTGLYYSVMIKASGGNRYRIAMKNTDRSHYGFLDEDFNILVLNANNRDTVVAPKNTKYLIWYLSSTGLTSENNVQIELVENNNLIPTSYEPYRGNDICIAQGEIDLPKDMFEQGGFSANNGSGSTYETMKYDSTIRLRSKSLIRVKPNTTYYIKNNLPRVIFNLYQWNASVEFMQGTSKTNNASELLFTTTNDTHYIHFLFSKYGNENITVSEFDWSFFQLVELDSTVQLRSLPNGVKDELNLLTGEYIQRVGEVVLDGSEQWTVGDGGVEKGMKYFMTSTNYPQGIKLNTTTTKLTTQAHGYPNITFSDVWNERQEGISSSNGTVGLRAVSSVYSTVDEWKAFLQTNPVTVQYELAEPIISYPRIVSNTQEREVGVKLPNGVCDTYNPSTGITVKRVGRVVLDGSEQWEGAFSAGATVSGMYYFTYDNTTIKRNTTIDVLTTVSKGGFKSLPFSSVWNLKEEGISSSNSTGLGLRLATKCANTTAVKSYLQSNPTTVYYELANPIVTTDIVLPNGVHDEYNPLTGLYTKRVGYVELDGSDDEKLDSVINNLNKENTIVFFARQYTPLAKKYEDKGKGYPIYTNQFEYVDIDLGQTDGGGMNMDVEGAYMAFDGNVCFAISKKTLEPFGFTNDMNMRTQVIPIISKYLSQNPIKVWYELATPVTYQLTPYFGLPMPYAYKDGHLIMDSAYDGQSLPPEFKYQVLTNRTGQITQNNIKLKEHTARLSNLEYILIEATIESLFNRELQLFELELMDIQLIDLGE